MLAAAIDQGSLILEEKDRPEPGPEQALVRVHLAGICGTDLEILAGYAGFSGTPGHEFVGRVVQARERPEIVGCRAVADINFGCGHCRWCLRGDQRHCVQRRVLGIREHSGAFAHYVLVPAANLYPVPDDLADEEAVFAEPLAAALEVTQQVHVTAQTRTAVLGDGKLGLLCALALDHYTPSLTLFGRHSAKLHSAARQGISTVLLPPQPQPSRLDPRFDLVVECTGRTEGIHTALDLVRPEGSVVLKTTSHQATTLDMSRVVVNELSILGSRCGDIGLAMHFLARKWIDVRPLIEAVFPLADIAAAVQRAGQKGALKVLVNCL
jgi:threonine dehydrogenase-like Zn-dependent dehydrogenase